MVQLQARAPGAPGAAAATRTPGGVAATSQPALELVCVTFVAAAVALQCPSPRVCLPRHPLRTKGFSGKLSLGFRVTGGRLRRVPTEARAAVTNSQTLSLRRRLLETSISKCIGPSQAPDQGWPIRMSLGPWGHGLWHEVVGVPCPGPGHPVVAFCREGLVEKMLMGCCWEVTAGPGSLQLRCFNCQIFYLFKEPL